MEMALLSKMERQVMQPDDGLQFEDGFRFEMHLLTQPAMLPNDTE